MIIKVEVEVGAVAGSKVWVDDKEVADLQSILIRHIAGSPATVDIIKLKRNELGQLYIDELTMKAATEVVVSRATKLP